MNEATKPMRTDKIRNLEAVASVVLQEPLLTEREIAAETGLGKSTVHRAMEELGQNGAIKKNPDIIRIVDRDKKIISEAQDILEYAIKQVKDGMARQEQVGIKDAETVAKIAKESTSRVGLFGGDASDEGGGLKYNFTSNLD